MTDIRIETGLPLRSVGSYVPFSLMGFDTARTVEFPRGAVF
jgi:hypothetical protein